MQRRENPYMFMLLTSTTAIFPGGKVDQDLVDVLVNAAKQNPVAIVSNKVKPPWFNTYFAGTQVQFVHQIGRQNGAIVSENATALGLLPHDIIVLALTNDDIQMAKNGSAIPLAAGWSTDKSVKAAGVSVDNAQELQGALNIINSWNGQWWYSGACSLYKVRALANLSTFGPYITQQQFATRLTNTIKNRGSNLSALETIAAKSLLMDNVNSMPDLVFGVYPSSGSANNDTEVLSDFTHRLRKTVARVRNAKQGEPLFIRHTASVKRSITKGSQNRNDPSDQVTSIHLNPYYEQSSRLVGKNIIVVDDCTTYGASFGVAAAFLRAAGAKSITGVALGKFGGVLNYYDINILSDPYAPVTNLNFSIVPATMEQNNSRAQSVLPSLIP